MKDKSQYSELLKYLLPEEIFRYFLLTAIKEEGKTLHLYLEENNEKPEEYFGDDLESKGFHPEVVIKDFPIRDRAMYLHIRRRRWLNKTSSTTVSRDWNLVAEGTHYTQGFASFLKELIGYLPDRQSFP